MGLSTEEMAECGELINLAFLSVYSNSLSSNHEKLLKFTFGLIKEQVPHLLFSGQTRGMKQLNDLMFNDPTITDFVLKITFHFFSKFGNTLERYPQLVENLASGLGYLKPVESRDHQTVVATPPDFYERISSVEDVQALLLDNRWMVTMVLLMLYLMTPDDLAELQQAKIDAARAERAAARNVVKK